MDVVQQILSGDPYFRQRMRSSGTCIRKNRRGVAKRYSRMTASMVSELARLGLDAVSMRRHEVIARAFQFFALEQATQLVA